jgi:hypothetical protein
MEQETKDISKIIDVHGVVDFLNSLLTVDSEAVSKIFLNRVECNKHLLNHPTVQVGLVDGSYKVGALGLLNGLCFDKEVIALEYFEGSQEIVRFVVQEKCL